MTTEHVSFAMKMSDWENANWQLMFKTVDGLDYCRETVTIESFPDRDAIAEHAAFLLTLNNDTDSVVIGRW